MLPVLKKASPITLTALFVLSFVVLSLGFPYFRGEAIDAPAIKQAFFVGTFTAVLMYFWQFKPMAAARKAEQERNSEES